MIGYLKFLMVGTLLPLQDWSLMCPNECPGLDEVWGEEFEKLYERYGKNTKVIMF